ncbi:hypothetical protein JCM12141A_56930 [Mycolicibacterium hodleri]
MLSMNQPGSGARLRASSFTTTAVVTTMTSTATANQLSIGRVRRSLERELVRLAARGSCTPIGKGRWITVTHRLPIVGAVGPVGCSNALLKYVAPAGLDYCTLAGGVR